MSLNGAKRLSWHGCLAVVMRRPLWTLLIVAGITLLLGWQLPSLSFKTSIYDLIIEQLPESKQYREFHEQFGSDEIIRLVIKAKNVFDTATFTRITRMSEAAGRIAGVRRIISLPEMKQAVDIGNAWSLDEFRALLAPVKLFQRNLISEDQRTTIITLVLGPEADKDAVIAEVDRLISSADEPLQLYQTGMPLVSQALAAFTQQDFFHLTPITLIVIAILLIVFFRNVHCLVLPLACVLLSMIWTFGAMAWTGHAVSMLTTIVPVFLIAVGTAYCLHICAEYLHQTRTATSVAAAVEATFGHMTFPVTLAVLTTMIGIGSLAVNPIRAIQEFAFCACFGMTSLLVIVLTFFPAVLILLPPPAKQSAGQSLVDRAIDRLLALIVNLNLKHQRRNMIIIGLVTVVCIAGLFGVRVETNPVSYFKSGTPVSRNFHDIYEQMSGSFPINVTMTGKTEAYFENPDNVARIKALQDYLERLPGVDKTISLADYLMLVNYAYNQYDPQYYTLPGEPYELRMLINNFKILLGNDLMQRFMSPDYNQTNILMLTHIASSREFLKTKADIVAHAEHAFGKELAVGVTGLGVVIAASSHLLTVGQIKSLSISLVLIFGVMAALFVSAKVGLIAVLPNLFPILVNFGLMGLFGIPLSTATSLIASVAIGLAVDDTIHYLVRYNTEFKKHLNKDRAMRDTLMAVGRPMLFTSCTIGLGFTVLIFSHFQPTSIFGVLMVVTMVSALIGDTIILPTLMMHVELVTAWDLLKMMPTVGGLPPSMVHELNQPLNAIKVGSDFIRRMLRQGAQLNVKHLESVSQEISAQVKRAAQIIQRIDGMSELPRISKGPVQLNLPIRRTIEILGNQFKLDNIEVRLELDDVLPAINGQYNQLVQVIYNLLDNAQNAILAKKDQRRESPEPDTITIRTFTRGRTVQVAIADTGVGIPEHHLDRVYEPFFTTKDEGQGKGLGLTICRQIVRDFGGQIKVESGIEQGTIVTLVFPVLEEAGGAVSG